jgi:alpha-1,6-mannosyltransferase
MGSRRNWKGWLAVGASLAGVLCYAAYASAPGSPFQVARPAGVSATGPFVWLGRTLGFDRVPQAHVVGVGVAVTVFSLITFFALLLAAWRGYLTLRTVLVLVVAYHVAVLMMPLLFSRDVYSYAFYGRILAIYHANPYVRTPFSFPSDPLSALAGPKWVATPAVYGPAFTLVSGFIARLLSSPTAQVSAYRAIAVTASLGTVFLIAYTARAVRPVLAVFAVAAFGANPVILFHTAASGHNDLLVALCVAGALAVLLRGGELTAVGLLSVATAIKVSAALPLLLLIVWCVARRPAGARIRALLTRAGLALAIGLAFALPFLQGQDPTLGLRELSKHRGWLAPSSLLQRRVAEIFSHGVRSPAVPFLAWCLLVILSGGLVIRVARTAPGTSVSGNGAAWTWGLLILMLLGPVLLPWYVAWALPFVWLVPWVPRAAILATGALVMFGYRSAEVLGFDAPVQQSWAGRWLLPICLCIVAAVTIVDLVRRLAKRLPLEEEERVTAERNDR